MASTVQIIFVPLLVLYILLVHEYEEKFLETADPVLPGRQKFKNVNVTKAG